MSRKTNTYNVTRDGRFWLIHVPEIDRFTQARNLREVDEMVVDLISVIIDQPPIVRLSARCHQTPRIGYQPRKRQLPTDVHW